jgi:hypothetical protein
LSNDARCGARFLVLLETLGPGVDLFYNSFAG